VAIRDVSITNASLTDISEAWQEVADASGHTLEDAVFAEFDFAEEVICLLRYKDRTGYCYEVGIGESLRPYERLYLGRTEREAEDRFWQAVTLHVRNM
jgi:hypothetical protein